MSVICAGTIDPYGIKAPKRVLSGPNGALAKISLFIHAFRATVNAGPYQWFHHYTRCLDCIRNTTTNAWINIETFPFVGSSRFQSTDCCKCREDPNYDATCFQTVPNKETGGFPSGCPGFPQNWSPNNVLAGSASTVQEPKCGFNNLADSYAGAKTMVQYVQDFADDLNYWVPIFQTVYEKMMRNGYTDASLTAGLDIFGVGRTICSSKKNVYTCGLTVGAPPSAQPTIAPTSKPTTKPTSPSSVPTIRPTKTPSIKPSAPTCNPSLRPHLPPTGKPFVPTKDPL